MSTSSEGELTFDDLTTVAGLVAGFPAPWYVSGGWAIDLFLGTTTRAHEDLEIGVARADQALLHRQLGDRDLRKIVPRGETFDLLPWSEGEWLELPIHQIIVPQAPDHPVEFQFFLNEVWSGEWRFRPDQTIRRPVEECYDVSPFGIPALAPEIQLLYKCRRHGPKDEHDFRVVLPHLDASRRAWLSDALRRFRPDDPWLRELETSR
ncbi:MAG TPA: hypothetical protein VFU72_13420 [Nitrolancea sp.]|nr:hypothetical protein [Nitrolancea sp.]